MRDWAKRIHSPATFCNPPAAIVGSRDRRLLTDGNRHRHAVNRSGAGSLAFAAGSGHPARRSGEAMDQHDKVRAAIAYDDLREWPLLAERPGKVGKVCVAFWAA
jgi:hypothetical protein